MTTYLSHKLTILYTLLIVMVVYIHSRYVEADSYQISSFLQNLTGKGICRIANCLFFCISGYLFARNINSLKEAFHKVRRRLHTLLLPYLLWNLIFVLWYVVLECIPGIGQFNNSNGTLDRLLHQSILATLYDLFVCPAAFQLWFLRDMLVMILFTPVLWLLSKWSWLASLLLAFASVAVYPWLVYFWMGMIMAIRQWDIESYPRSKTCFGVCCFLFLAYAVYIAMEGIAMRWIEMAVNFMGLFSLWSLYDMVARGRCCADKGVWKYICGYSFFIYCFHEPTFNIIKKLAVAIAGTNEPSLILFYYINPWIMVGIAILTAKCLKHFSPYIYQLLTGGR